jgi:hypothetical protein
MTEPNLDLTENNTDINETGDETNVSGQSISLNPNFDSEDAPSTAVASGNDTPKEDLSGQISNEKSEEKMIEIKNEEKAVESPVSEEIRDENEIHEIEVESVETDFHEDFGSFAKKDFVNLAEKMLASLSSRELSISDLKNIDSVLKEIKPLYEELHQNEKNEAKKAYIAENGSEEGFEFKNDNFSIRFESLLIQIRDKKQSFFHKLEQQREDYFEIKTKLLQRLREIVDIEDKGVHVKDNWEAFKQVQSDWKAAGNVNSPHNGTLWSAYNALVDRYFDIRSIQNELKDLDRKKNIENKAIVVTKIEAIAEKLKTEDLTNSVLKRANDLLNEYKQIGPGIRDEQEALWTRLKSSFDVIYEKKRELNTENKQLSEEIFGAKARLLENLKPFTEFKSDSINEWNAKTKEVMAIQDQWNAIKGPMPRDRAKEISKDFWAYLKQFFKHKTEFFSKLEAQRVQNFKAKEALCIQVDEILASDDTSAANTNKIIDLQKKWKTIGHVPEKYKDSLYNRFKASCDKYFEAKRTESKDQDNEYAVNLKKKQDICDEIEKLTKKGEADLSKLTEYKKAFAAIGFVPRKDMQSIQSRFVAAINEFVKASTSLNKSEKEKLMLQNEVEVVLKSGGGSKNLDKQENDLRRKIKGLEDEIALLKNNIEFFGNSKNADKFKAEYEQKISKAEVELKELGNKLKLIIEAS